MTAPTVQAIETVYAGHRFRSRLEARWAVFFDALGVRWQYEPQGYRIGMPCANYADPDDPDDVLAGVPADEETRYYLPDFYLPDHGTWVEVKGQINADVTWLMLNAVDPSTGPTLPGVDKGPRANVADGSSNGLLVVGEIPPPVDAGQVITHDMLTGNWFCSALIHEYRFDTRDDGDGEVVPLLDSYGGPTCRIRVSAGQWVCATHPNGCSQDAYYLRPARVPMDPAVLAAYDAARQARFEHGESGTRRAPVGRTKTTVTLDITDAPNYTPPSRGGYGGSYEYGLGYGGGNHDTEWSAVRFTYNPEMVETLKNAIHPEDRRWEPDDRCWYVNTRYVDDLIHAVEATGMFVDLQRH